MSEEDKVDRFVRGLQDDLRADVRLYNPQTLAEAEEKAIIIDDTKYQKRATKPDPRAARDDRRTYPPAPPRPSQPTHLTLSYLVYAVSDDIYAVGVAQPDRTASSAAYT